MKNILSIVCSALLLGFLCSVITGKILTQMDKKKSEAVEHRFEPDGNPMQMAKAASAETNRQFKLMKERDKKAKIAGAIGLVAGLGGGFWLVRLRERKEEA